MSPSSVKQKHDGWWMSYLLALLRRHPDSACPCRAVSKWVTSSPPPSACVAVHSAATCWPEADCLPEPSIHPPQTHWEAHTEITDVTAVCLLFFLILITKQHFLQQLVWVYRNCTQTDSDEPVREAKVTSGGTIWDPESCSGTLWHKEEPGFEPPTLRLIDDLLCLLSCSCPKGDVKQGAGQCDPVVREISLTFH